jgi:hypothetical protein
MLRKTVYFRTQEDLDKFNAIGNKAEWLHDKLNADFNPVMVIDSSTIVMPTRPNIAPIEPTTTPPEEAA